MTGVSASAEERLGAFSREKAKLLKLLIEEDSRRTQRIKPYPRGEGANGRRLPTSWAQQRLWFIDQLEGGSAAYHFAVAFRLQGVLDEEALQKALNGLVQRHEVLRTVFVSAEGDPRQEITVEGRFALKMIDLRGYEVAEREARVRLQKIEETHSKFDLRVGPLIRGRLLRVQAEEHVLLVTMHHIISDGWSMGVLFRNIEELYRASREGRGDPLEPLSIQYADYAQWQRQWLQGEVLDKQLTYWRVRLRGVPPQMELPTDRPRPAVQSYRGETLGIVLDALVSTKLKTFAQRREMTLFMVLYAGWAILLSRLSGQDDVVVGTPVANRQRSELEGLIGFFVNTLVLRVEVHDDLRVEELLERVKDVAVGAYDHQDVPFEQVVEALHPQRSLNRNPLFQVMLTLQNAPKSELRLPGLTVTLENGVDEPSMFDLQLSLEERGDEIVGSVNYATDLFDRETVNRWMASFIVLLRGMTDEVHHRIGDLQILPESERQQIVECFNAPPVTYPQEKLIHELFEGQVRWNPNAIAVVYGQESLTYAGLNGRANQLARYLRKKGVGPDQLVGLCVERSLEMVVGLLGILKAGGAYVPLDPSYPAERLDYILKDAVPRVLLIQERLRASVPDTAAEVIALDNDWNEIDENITSNLDLRALGLNSHHLAYVIYTSGSTGDPKGVMVEHRNVTRLFAATEKWFAFNERDVWTLFHSFAFDFSVWELWGALLYGGRVVVVPYLTARSPQEFYRLLCAEGVTVLNQTPSAFAQLIDAQAQSAEKQHSLRVVIFGGEALELHTLQPWVERNGAERPQLVNMYGITETTVHVTYRLLSGEEIELERGSLIGKPIPDLQAYLLDRYKQPVPIGVVGEIYIGGAGVARGYLNRSELTAERFLLDPFSSDPQARLYKSGDLGRWRPDGTIEYLGRNDHQVKIRGFRIELGEIEAQLARHAQVKEAVVIAREDVPGEKRLVAYVIPEGPSGAKVVPSVEELRAHLKAVLPDYMVPGAFVVLESLPLTPNGKLDRRGLPAPELGAYVSRQYEAPQGEVEEILAGIWQELLRVERVGRQDNFFELGGHSLLIVQMKERLRRVGLTAEVRRVFESPTLADLASALTNEAVGQFEVPPNLIPPGCEVIRPQMLPLVELEQEHIERIAQLIPGGVANIQDIYPMAPLQEGILFHHLFDEQSGDTYVLPTVLSVSSRERLEELIAALQAVIDRHDILRTAVLWEQLPRPVQVVYRQATLPVEEIPLGRDPAEQIKEWIKPERQRLDLRQAPLMRLQVAADVHGTQYALLQLHHIVCDHMTAEVVISEIVAHLEGHGQRLPESVPYRNHVAQALAHARTHDAEVFFRRKLEEVDEPTAPFGLLDVHGNGSRIEEASEELQPALAQRARARARHLSVSAATLFHVAWGLVVARTSGRDDVVFGSVLLGRLQGNAGAQRILGMFINTLPLRLKLKGVTVKKLVHQTQRELVELLNHEQASLAVAQRCSGIVGSAPLFSSLLNYRHSVPDSKNEWAGAKGIGVLASQERTNYPISLSVDDLGQGFTLTAQTDERIDPHRVMGYMSTALQSLVEALEQAPWTPALALSILPESERHQVIELFNATQATYPQEKLIHELFEEQVERTPDAVAVVHEGQSLTYIELNGKANQLARYLRDKGVGPDQLVALCVERSLEMVVGLLGILKAGGAYVPLDPNYPAERLSYILKNADPRVLLIQERLRERVPDTAAQVIALDDWNAIAEKITSNLDLSALGLHSKHLAYVIYTSGSTGAPKGVMVEHAGVVNFLTSMQQNPGISATDCMLAVTTLSFDIAALEIYLPLVNGAKLVLASRETAFDAQLLMAMLEEFDITVLQATPATWHLLLSAGWSGRKKLKALCGGEALTTDLSGKLASRVGDLWNLYGPTETTIWSCGHQITVAPVERESVESIGRPIANTQIYILSSQQRPVPIGVVGEIYIGGAGVARGYLNRSELTAERFLLDPFSSDPQARLYKSGDLGRWRPDGTIEYLGRNDHQVKIRGFRIELGEIEAQLARHAQVKEAVVIAREDVPGEKRLVAYVIPEGPSGAKVVPSVEELRAHLKAVLPDYMVPGAFVVLESLPLTPNGKLDRRGLPAPELGAYVSRQYEAPQGEVEEILAGIWQELLRVERVGRQDNFFELGGHSLLIVQMKERLRRVGLTAEVRRVFESPTLADLASALTNEAVGQFEVPPNLIPPGCEVIRPQMLPLVELEQEHIERIAQLIPGGVANIQDIYPMAPLQEGILFHHLFDEQSGDTYVLPTLLSLSSRERLEQFVRALQAVIDRHDILRTAVLWEQLPLPVQVVYRRATLPVEQLTLDRNRDPVEQLKERMRPERQRLDLRQAPLMRLQVAADVHGTQYALLRLHHIVCDHGSLEILIAEVMAYVKGHAQALPEPVPYRNHVAQALAHARTHDAEAFFSSKLREIDEPTTPFGLLDVHGDGSRIEEVCQAVQPTLAKRIRTQARHLSTSSATLFHAAWGLVVARTSGRGEVVYGSALLGRLQGSAGAQRVMGMFMNTLPLRLRLQSVTAKELVEQTQRELVDLLNHEQASLAVAQRCSGIAGSAPLFSTLLNYRHSSVDFETEFADAEGVTLLASHSWTNYPITITVDDQGEEFVLIAQTDERIDPHRVMGYMSTALQSLVEALEQAPWTPALALSILPESERHQVIELFNATQATYPQEKLIHELFEEQVERTPDAVAVVHEGQSLTYIELNGKANQLARYLRDKGVGPDQLVALCVERSLEMVVGLLGILKAGGAYVPLDPNYPAERLQYMLTDSAPQVVLTQEGLRATLPITPANVVALDTLLTELAVYAEANLLAAELGLTERHIVYVIYTSGSTGRPKGTAMSHHAMVNLIEWHRKGFIASQGRRVLQFAALSFDVAFQEIFSTLCTGGNLVLLGEWIRRDPRALTEFLNSHSIERLFVPPLMLQSLAECCQATSVVPRRLRDVIVAGEQLRVSPEISSFLKRLDGCRLHNHYGPTETHVVTALSLTQDTGEWPALPTIGRPISNTQIYILDKQRQPVPIGLAGEIYIAGAGVARGYLRRPELTAERFIADPFSTDPKVRLYKTGDLGQWRTDGTLEYLGRNDNQVKIRGYRIELGEVELHLARHDQVKEAAVIAREDVPAEIRMVAYITQRDPSGPSAEELRAYLMSALPDYMVPGAFIVLESLPRTPSGKLDRRALPVPELGVSVNRQYDIPQGEVEEVLAEIWRELLRVEWVGRQDNFFELGGHSMHGMKLIVKVAERFRVGLSVIAVFQYPTIQQMAKIIEALPVIDVGSMNSRGLKFEEGVI